MISPRYEHLNKRRTWPHIECDHPQCELARRALVLIERDGVVERDHQGDRITEKVGLDFLDIYLTLMSQTGDVMIYTTESSWPCFRFDLHSCGRASVKTLEKLLDLLKRHMVLDDLADV